MKKLKSVLIIVFLIVFSLSSFSFATSVESKDSEIQVVSMSDKTIEINKEFYLILNLSNISFSKFKVEIKNTSNLSIDEVTSTVSDLSTNSVITSFIVDKSSINLEKLGVVYTSPKKTSIINFEVRITSLDETLDSLKNEQIIIQTELNTFNSNLEKLNETLSALKSDFEKAKTEGLEEDSEEYKKFVNQIEEAESGKVEIENNIENKNKENQELINKITNFKEETLFEELEIEVVEQIQNLLGGMKEDDKSDAWNDKENMLMMKEKNKEMTTSMKEMMSKMSNLEDANNTISSLTKTETYQGSQNNYLKSLSIEGIEFKNSFKKTTLNYFATLVEDVSKVTVNAVAEDSTAIITIYGNTDLKEGKNKILITVTADDGSIRTYKIYITK